MTGCHFAFVQLALDYLCIARSTFFFLALSSLGLTGFHMTGSMMCIPGILLFVYTADLYYENGLCSSCFFSCPYFLA